MERLPLSFERADIAFRVVVDGQGVSYRKAGYSTGGCKGYPQLPIHALDGRFNAFVDRAAQENRLWARIERSEI